MPFLGKVPSQIVDPEVDIDGGTIDGATIGSITAGAGTFTNLSATGTITFPDDGISGDDINGGTISNFASTGIDDDSTSTQITLNNTQTIVSNILKPASIKLDGSTGITWEETVGDVLYTRYGLSYGGNRLSFTYDGSTIARFLSSGEFEVYNDLTVDTDTLVVDSTNNRVGIGTTDPSSPLEVVGVSPIRLTRSGLGGPNLEFANDDGVIAEIQSLSSKSLVFTADPSNDEAGTYVAWEVDSTERMRIESDGDVRLGYYTASGSAGSLLDLTFVNTNNTEHNAINFQSDNSAGRCYINYERGSSSGQGDLIFGSSNAERMRISHDGNVGINTGSSTIRSKLDVVQNTNSTDAIRVYNSTGGSGSTQGKTYIGIDHWGQGGTYPSVRIGSEEQSVADYDASFVIQTRSSNSDVAPTTRFTVAPDGHVGVGEPNPDTRLEVAASGASNSFSRAIKVTEQGVDAYGGEIGARFVASNNKQGLYVEGYNSLTLKADSTAIDFIVGAGNAANDTDLKMRLDASGNLLVGTTVNSGRVSIQGQNSTSANNAIHVRNSSPSTLFAVRNDGVFQTGSAANSPYNLTTANSANVWVNASGTLFRSTSSARYKENIRDYDQTASIDSLRPVFFNSKNEDDTRTYAGLIAEEVHDAGFTEFVEYNEAGEPDAVFYANMVALCIKEIQDLKAEVAALKGA